MARILGLEEVSHSLRAQLAGALRVCDEATVLPCASRSSETGAFKNVVVRMSGADAEVNPDVFSPAWFSGVSAMQIPAAVAEPVLKSPERRAAVLRELAAQTPSEMADSELQVGPDLDADECDRDTGPWTAGFDSGSCLLGLYSAQQRRAPDASVRGMDRVHQNYYLVCKAGGGVAAQTFHSRLSAALRGGKTLDDALEAGNEPGPQALRRVSLAAQRNRARLLLSAAKILGHHTADTIGDNASFPGAPIRGAVTCLDVSYNTLRKIDGTPRSTWQYAAGCIDAQHSTGLLCASNVAEGFISFTTENGEFRTSLRNDAHSSIPFSTPRLASGRELAVKAASAARSGQGHPDRAYLKTRFAWKSKELGQRVEFEPPCLWGSHECENFLAAWARELGLAGMKQVRLQPEAVVLSAMEPAKLRAVAKTV